MIVLSEKEKKEEIKLIKTYIETQKRAMHENKQIAINELIGIGMYTASGKLKPQFK